MVGSSVQLSISIISPTRHNHLYYGQFLFTNINLYHAPSVLVYLCTYFWNQNYGVNLIAVVVNWDIRAPRRRWPFISRACDCGACDYTHTLHKCILRFAKLSWAHSKRMHTKITMLLLRLTYSIATKSNCTTLVLEHFSVWLSVNIWVFSACMYVSMSASARLLRSFTCYACYGVFNGK